MLGRILGLSGLSAALVLSGATALHAQTADYTPTIAVDAYGTKIGEVLRMDFSLDRMHVAMDVEGQRVFVLVYRDAFSHGARPVVFFEAPGCVGPAYMTADGSTLGTPAAVAGPAGTLYLGDPATEQSRQLASTLWSSTCEPFDAAMPVMDAIPAVDLGLQFVAPYAAVAADTGGGGRKSNSRKR